MRLESIRTCAWCVCVCMCVCVTVCVCGQSVLSCYGTTAGTSYVHCLAPYYSHTGFSLSTSICVSSGQISPKGRLTQLAAHTILYFVVLYFAAVILYCGFELHYPVVSDGLYFLYILACCPLRYIACHPLSYLFHHTIFLQGNQVTYRSL